MTELIIVFGLLGLLVGIALRTFAPFAQKLYEGSITWEDFLNRFLALAAAAYVAIAGFYLNIAPLTDEPIMELLLGFFLGIAGNEIANRIYHYIEVFQVKRKYGEVRKTNQ